MTDELLLRRLRAVLWSVNGEPNANGNVDETACSEAAARIEQLTAERDKYEDAWMTAEGKLADAEALIEAQAKDHASNNIRFAEAEHRAKTAEAERDRLREALEHIILDCEADYPPSHGAIKYAAKLALKGESHE